MKSKVGQSKYIVSLGRGNRAQISIDKEQRTQRPIYRQIAGEITHLIEAGLLPEGSRLPTVRELAKQLEVTRVTIHSAYNELRTQGWADATIGRGTFVTRPYARESLPTTLSSSHQVTPDRVMADLSVFKERTDLISLAMAEPDKSLLPAREFVRLFRSLEKDAAHLLSYGPYQGDPQLRQMIAGFVKEKGIQVEAEDVIVTSGVTQGLSLAVSALCQPGDKVLVEQPTYLGMISLLQSHGLEAVGISLQPDGPDLKALTAIMKREKPKVFYTIPSFHNPLGVCMSPEKRKAVLALAQQHGVTIIEDDVYGYLQFGTEALPAIKANDDGHVVYISSFSKLLLPGLRVGYIIPPPAVKDHFMSLVRCRELSGSMLLQQGLTEFLRRGLLNDHLNHVLPEYERRKDALLSALMESMPEDVTWSKPNGGFCCWVTLPQQGNFDNLYHEALNRGVAFTPGVVFFLNSNTSRHFRLCYSTQPPEAIQTAIQTLGNLVKELMRRPAPLETTPNSPDSGPIV